MGSDFETELLTGNSAISVRSSSAIQPHKTVRWRRVSNRFLFVLTTIVAIILGWTARERHQSEKEERIAYELSGLAGWDGCIALCVPYEKPPFELGDVSHRHWRYLLLRRIGWRVERLSVHDHAESSPSSTTGPRAIGTYSSLARTYVDRMRGR